MTDIFLVPMSSNSAGAATVGEYLLTLLYKVWAEEQEFNGKRPFGDSGWQWEVHHALADAGLIETEEVVYGEGKSYEFTETTISREERTHADEMILDAINEMMEQYRG